MSKTFEKEFARKAAPMLAEHGLRILPMESGMDEGTDDEISFVDANGRKSLVALQVSNMDSGGSYVGVGITGLEIRELAGGWSYAALQSIRQLPQRRKTDVDAVLADVAKGLENTAYAVDPASGPDPRAIDHPLLLDVIDELSAFDDVGLAPFRIDDHQGILAVRGTDTLRYEARPGEIAVTADDGTRTVVVNRSGKDAFRAAIREAAVEHLGLAAAPAP